MSDAKYLDVADEASMRLVLSRRLRDSLIDGMLQDGASQKEIEDSMGVVTAVATELLDSLGIVFDEGAIRVKR